MIVDVLERFQAFQDPLSGSVRIEAFWVSLAKDEADIIIVGELKQGLSRSYPSLKAANSSAQAFPQFQDLALKFQTEPFSAIAGLLEALRQAQAQEELNRVGEIIPPDRLLDSLE